MLAEIGIDAAELPLPQIMSMLSVDTLPTVWQDGVPTEGGRSSDRFIVICAAKFGWPPDVTRRQTLRDLQLLFESQVGAK